MSEVRRLTQSPDLQTALEKVNVRTLIDQARRVEVDLEAELGGEQPIGIQSDGVDARRRAKDLPQELSGVLALVDEHSRANLTAYYHGLSSPAMARELELLRSVLDESSSNVEQSKLSYVYLTLFQCLSASSARIDHQIKKAVLEVVSAQSGITDAGKIGLLTASDVQKICLALERLRPEEYARLQPLLARASSGDPHDHAFRRTVLLAAIGARAHLFTDQARSVDDSIARVFEGGLRKSPLEHELDQLVVFGEGIRGATKEELLASQTLLYFARGPYESTSFEGLFEKIKGMRDAGAVWTAYASGCLPTALLLLQRDPLERQRLTESIQRSGWLPSGLLADQIGGSLEELSGTALPFLARVLIETFDNALEDAPRETADRLRAIVSRERELLPAEEKALAEVFPPLKLPLRELLEIVRTFRDVQAGPGVLEPQYPALAKRLLPLQELSENWLIDGDADRVAAQITSHFERGDGAPYYLTVALADGTEKMNLRYVTLEVTGFDARSNELTVDGKSIPLRIPLDPEAVKLHAQPEASDFAVAYPVLFDFSRAVDDLTHALVGGGGGVLLIEDAADPSTGHCVAVLRTRPASASRWNEREFLVCDPRSQYFLEWVSEPSFRDASFLRSFTRYRQPIVSRIMVER